MENMFSTSQQQHLVAGLTVHVFLPILVPAWETAPRATPGVLRVGIIVPTVPPVKDVLIIPVSAAPEPGSPRI